MTLDKNLPLVQISVKRTQLTFVVDSAASGCLISKQRAEAIGLKVAMEGVSSGSGGFQSVGIIRGVRLWLGGMQLEPADCYTFDLTTLKFKSQVDGVPGSPLFRKYVVEIDYPGSRVRVFPPRRHRPSARAQVYRVRVAVGPIARGSIRVRGKAPIAICSLIPAAPMY